MNSPLNNNISNFWNSNIELFKKRFPKLIPFFEKQIEAFCNLQISDSEAIAFPQNKPNWEISISKTGIPTASEFKLRLHSAYNPIREAESSVATIPDGKEAAGVFCAFGLGYQVQAFARKYPNRPVIIIEPDINYLFAAFCLADWKDTLNHKECVFAVAAQEHDVISVLNQYDIKHCQIFIQAAQIAHASQYFANLTELIKRNLRKADINAHTLEQFSKRWMYNSCKNLIQFGKSDGIARYINAAFFQNETLPVVMIAAGPSLESLLPHLKEIKKRAIIVCVDTALRTCLKAGVEPDFIVLVDPQYWAYRHIAGLKAKSSILIAESAVYPAALRFDCKEIIMCSSLFPLGKYFESIFYKKGELGAGGSVSTTAWDFARITGCKEIFVAGLDLGYSGKNTHVRGCSFEENIHASSTKIESAETSTTRALYINNPIIEKDYTGKDIITDDKMKMYAWWFESNIAKYKEQKTYSLTANSLNIPGINYYPLEEFLKRPEKTELRKSFFKNAENNKTVAYPEQKFDEAIKDFKRQLENLAATAKKGISIAENALKKPLADYNSVFSKLSAIDMEIAKSEMKQVAALIFPTEKQLTEILNKTAMPVQIEKQNITRSKVVYQELLKAIKKYQKNLQNL
ncbi:MAG: DUF115 domain-containing protein [Treponema sp.]|nr:DUF115 domain-containing protein [Treponema sp.]